jgi:hypothetical protein
MSLLLGILNAQAAGGGADAFDLLETTTLATSAASVSFSGLSAYSDYRHLQIRYVARGTSGNALSLQIQLNNDAGANYTSHRLIGYQGGVQSLALVNAQQISWNFLISADANNTNLFSSGVIDVLDYSNTNKNTTLRALGGTMRDNNSLIGLHSGLFVNTSAITTILLKPSSVTFEAGSRFSLIGIK